MMKRIFGVSGMMLTLVAGPAIAEQWRPNNATQRVRAPEQLSKNSIFFKKLVMPSGGFIMTAGTATEASLLHLVYRIQNRPDPTPTPGEIRQIRYMEWSVGQVVAAWGRYLQKEQPEAKAPATGTTTGTRRGPSDAPSLANGYHGLNAPHADYPNYVNGYFANPNDQTYRTTIRF